MKKTKIFAMAMATMMSVGAMGVNALAESTSLISTNTELAPNAAQMHLTETEYISVSEYLAKYGEENVIKGFNEAEAQNKAMLLGTDYVSDVADINTVSDEPNDLFLSLQEGKFLGLEILGVSDLPPDDIRLSVKVSDNGFSESQNNQMVTEKNSATTSSLLRASNQKKSYANYDVYYSDNEPNNSTDLIGGAYESNKGSYIYKYSYAYDNNYMCTTQVQFLNTELKCGTQSNNMYTYVAAKSNQQTLDFGLMANPSAYNRNAGMYACYNLGNGAFDVETYPKVQAEEYGNNMMELEDKTVEIRLSIGNGTAEMYMESNGSCIYYKTINVSSLISGSSSPLTFLQAMSCVATPDSVNTSITSGAYFKNVRFNNSKLYSYDSGSARTFLTYGPYTYYMFVAKPSKVSVNYGSNYELFSINYN